MISNTLLEKKLFHEYSELFEEELIQRIIAVGDYQKIDSGRLLVDIDEELTHIPLILSGVVQIIRKDKNGFEFFIYYLEAGDTCAISFANCINKKKSIFRGVAESDVEAIFLPVDLVDEWLVKYKSWRHFVIDSYHFRLMEMVEAIDSLAFLKMEKRIWKYLTGKVRIKNNIDLEITHQKIAEDLNSTRVVITRILQKLHDEKKIYSTRNKIKLLKFYN